MLKLLLLGVLLACADPVLLYLLYRACGGLALLALVVVPPIAGGALVSTVVSRLEQKAAGRGEAGVGFGERATLVLARFLFWYPGPLTTLLALLLLVRRVRRAVHDWAFMALANAASSGTVSVVPSDGGGVFRSGPGAAQDPLSAGPSGPLKRAEGRVIEQATDDKQLPTDN